MDQYGLCDWGSLIAREAYLALQVTDIELLEGLAGLVAVADILESLGGVLASNVEQDLLATTVEKGGVSDKNQQWTRLRRTH